MISRAQSSGVVIKDSTIVVADSVLTDSLGQIKDSTLVAIDSSQAAKPPKPKPNRFEYIRVGIDISKVIRSALNKEYKTLAFQADATYTKDINLVAEGGYANAKTNTPSVSFTSNSVFATVGFDKNFFSQLFTGDKDNAFVGLRLGGALHRRGEAQAIIIDPFFGNQLNTIAARTNFLYWIGLTAGFRLEIRKDIFLGWNVRGKTFVNPKKIEELPPVYLAGYGNAEKKPVFDYNFYILYGFGKRR